MVKTSDSWNWENIDDINEYWMQPDGHVMNFAMKLLKDNKENVYDLGCGLGRHVFYLTDLGFKVSGSDSSVYAVEQVNKILEEKNISNRMDCLNMNLIEEEENKFDATIAFHSIYHNTYENMKNVIDIIWRMTKSDGKVFLSFLTSPSLEKENIEVKEYIKDEEPEKGVPHTILNKNVIPKILNKFSIKQIWNVEHLYDDLRKVGYHCFVEAEPKK